MPGRLSTEQPRWSPDAKAIVFSTGVARLFVLELPTGRLRFLTYGHDPEWSPDGRQIAFVRPGRDWTIGLIQADGSSEVALARIPAGIRGRLAWDPVGHTLFVVDGDGETLAIDTRDGKVRPAGLPMAAQQVICSPDGEWLAFTAKPGPDGTGGGVFLYHRRTARLVPVSPLAATKLCWTHRGRVLLALRPPESEYVRYDMATGRTQQVRASDGLIPLDPSPAADEVLHATHRAPGDLLLGEIGGSRVRSFAHGFHPAWSPDGEWVAFYHSDTDEGPLCTQSRNGANLTRWSNTPPAPPLQERLAGLLVWTTTHSVFLGLPALAASLATYPFLPGTGVLRFPLLLAAWVVCFTIYRPLVRWSRQLGRTLESDLLGHLLAVAPPGVLAALATATALSLPGYWVALLAPLWLAVCAFGATAPTRFRPGSHRALIAAWTIALAATMAAAAIHRQQGVRVPRSSPAANTPHAARQAPR